MVRRICRALAGAIAFSALAFLLATPTVACSPPLEKPTIAALGPGQVVVVGTTGEPVPGGRLFHVERAYSGGVTTTPIVIAFKEGEPIGDCSYPVRAGTHLIIAPYREPDGRLSADMGTLQADPASMNGRAYVAEAETLFGEGTIPVEIVVATAELEAYPLPPIGLIVAIGSAIVVGVVAVVAFWRRDSRRVG